MSTSSSLFLMCTSHCNPNPNYNSNSPKKAKRSDKTAYHSSSYHYQNHPFISPEDEEDLAHIHATFRFVLIIFGVVPVFLYLVAIWVAAHPHLYDITHGHKNYNEMLMKYVKVGDKEIKVIRRNSENVC